MAQKTEKEETEFKAPETLTRCVNNCGLAGSPATNNMCQNCFNAAIIKPPHIFPAAVSPRSGAPRALEPPTLNDVPPPPEIRLPTAPDPDLSRREVNRCFGCRRRVRLAGFRCRCGELFCAEHRYSDRHDCSYDYKSAGREAISRENPVVKAAKIVRV